MAKKTSLADTLMAKLISTTTSPYAKPITESLIFNRDSSGIPTGMPILDLALSAEIGKGLMPGILIIAGESKRFKTLFGLYLVAAFQRKNPNGITMFYDTEFGTPPAYLTNFGLDLSRIVHIPCSCVEDLRHEMAAQLSMLKENPADSTGNVMFFVDSIGNLPSRKEVDDAVAGSDKADMTRAKTLKSFSRIVTTDLQILNIPLVAINHVYKSTGTFVPMDIVSGGSGLQLAADNIWIISRGQEREAAGPTSPVVGYEFCINVNKSRFVKEKSKLPVVVHWKSGIHTYSGLADLALELGCVTKDKAGKAVMLVCGNKSVKEKNNDTSAEFWQHVLDTTNFKELLKQKFMVVAPTVDAPVVEEDE